MKLNVLAVGEVVGTPGLELLERRLRSVRDFYGADFVIVNGENASGVGITPSQADRILAAGADVITLGNHTFNRMEILDYLDDNPYILRPANYAPQVPGRGWGLFPCGRFEICVVNLIGRCGMQFGPDNPFLEIDRILRQVDTPLIAVDMHAEASSERLAMGYHLDGRASAVFGTHTHVQTSDCRILPRGTGHISDLGMTGPAESVLGIRPEQSVRMFLGNPPERYTTAPGSCKLEGAVFELDTDTGLCTAAESLRIMDGR